MSREDGVQGEGRVRLDHIPALDGLRGVAVAVVLWFHAGHLTGGYLGVDLFFTLSGYLITSLLVAEWRRTGTIALGPFWGRRVRRLLPALVVMLVAVGVAARWKVLPAARGDLRDAGLATLGYVANWQTILGGDGYWDQTLTPSWLEHTWSLAIEEQFYLLWPLVAVAVLAGWRRAGAGSDAAPVRSRERRVRRLGTVALAGAVLSGGGMIVASLAGASVERLYLGTDTRVAAILLGAAAACFQRAPGAIRAMGERTRLGLAAGAVVAAAFLAVTWTVLDGTSALLYRGGLLVCGLAAVVVILDISTPGRSLVGPVLALPPLRALGAISYGLYLYHWPIYRFLAETDLGLVGWNLTAAQVLASLAVAVASHRFLERPILERRWSWPSIRLAPIGVAAAVVALLVGSIGAVDIAPASQEATRPDLGPREAAARVVVSTTVPPAGETTPSTTAPVARVEELIDPVVLVVGDSVAFSLAEDGFVYQESILGLTTVNGAQIGCTLLRDVGAEPPPDAPFVENCSDDWPGFVAEYEPDVVMVLFGAYGGMNPTVIDGEDRWPCSPQYDRFWRQRLDEAVEVLSARGAVVDLVTAPTGNLLVGGDRDLFDTRQGCINAVIEDVAERSPKAQAIDMAEWICPEDECREKIDGVHLRNDGLHFRDAGALVVSRWLAPQLRRVEIEPGADTGAGVTG
ncbi:MAG TPA: acyltransferase family protein [Iamia sp.]|nr:acyltransferase family protein [Iamia sp.]